MSKLNKSSAYILLSIIGGISYLNLYSSGPRRFGVLLASIIAIAAVLVVIASYIFKRIRKKQMLRQAIYEGIKDFILK